MSATLSDVYYWWLDAFKGMPSSINLPRWLKSAAPHIVRMNKDGRIEFPTPERMTEGTEVPQQGPLVEQFRKIARDRKAGPYNALVRLDPKLFVVRSISPLNLPASQLAKTALLDLRANTPFKEHDVHVLRLEPNGSGARYAVVKRTMLDPLVSAMTSAGLYLHGIELESGYASESITPATLRNLTAGQKPRKRRLLITAFGILALASVLTGIHAWYRNQTVLQQLNAQVETLTVEAKVTRAALDKRAASLAELKALRKTIEDAEPVSGLWEELARILPDSTYLTDMEVKDGKVLITGYAAEAAALVVSLEQSPTFEQASFTAPVVRAFDQNAERFQISISVEGES